MNSSSGSDGGPGARTASGPAELAPAAGERPVRRRRARRRAKAKPKLQAPSAIDPKALDGNGGGPAKRKSRKSRRRETAGVTPAFLAREDEKRTAGAGRQPLLAAVAASDRVAAEQGKAEDSVGGERQWPWILLVCLLALGGFGYWKWQDLAPRYLQTAGDWTRARIEELAESVGLLPPPPAAVAPAAGTPAGAPEPAPVTAAKAKLEEVELPTPPPLLLVQVVELETLLQRLGFDPGEINGVVDDETRAAIGQFQEWDGQDADGEPSRALLDALREVAGYQGKGG